MNIGATNTPKHGLLMCVFLNQIDSPWNPRQHHDIFTFLGGQRKTRTQHHTTYWYQTARKQETRFCIQYRSTELWPHKYGLVLRVWTCGRVDVWTCGRLDDWTMSINRGGPMVTIRCRSILSWLLYQVFVIASYPRNHATSPFTTFYTARVSGIGDGCSRGQVTAFLVTKTVYAPIQTRSKFPLCTTPFSVLPNDALRESNNFLGGTEHAFPCDCRY